MNTTKNKYKQKLIKKVIKVLSFFIIVNIFISNITIAATINTPKVINPELDSNCPANAVSNFDLASSTNGLLIANSLMGLIPDSTDNTKSFVDFDGDGDSSIIFPTSTASLSAVDINQASIEWRSSNNKSLFINPYSFNNGYVAFYPTERIIKLCLIVKYSGENQVFLVKDIRLPKAEIKSFIDDKDNPNKTKKYYKILNDTFSNRVGNGSLWGGSINSGPGGYYGGYNLSNINNKGLVNRAWINKIFNYNGNALNMTTNFLDTGVTWDATTTRCASSIACTPDEIFRDIKNITSQTAADCVNIQTGADASSTNASVFGCGKWANGFSTQVFLSPAFNNARYITDYTIPQAPSFQTTGRSGTQPAAINAIYAFNRYGLLISPYYYLRGFFNPENRTAITATDAVGVFKGADPQSSFLPGAIAAEIHGGQYEPRIWNCNINDTILIDNGVYRYSPYNVNGRYNAGNIGFISSTTTDPRCSGRIESNMLISKKNITTWHSYFNNNTNNWNTPILFSDFKKGIPACRGKGTSLYSTKNIIYNSNSANIINGCENTASLVDRVGVLPSTLGIFTLSFGLSKAHGFRTDFTLTDNEMRQLINYPGASYNNFSVWLPLDERTMNINETNYFPGFTYDIGDVEVGQSPASGARLNYLLDEYTKNRSREIKATGSWRR